MNLLLALNNSHGIDSGYFGINSFYESFAVIVLIVIVFACILIVYYYFSPIRVLARAIKSLREIDKEYRIIRETDTFYLLENGIKVYNDCYDSTQDIYTTDYGYYIPIYNSMDDVISFIFMKK